MRISGVLNSNLLLLKRDKGRNLKWVELVINAGSIISLLDMHKERVIQTHYTLAYSFVCEHKHIYVCTFFAVAGYKERKWKNEEVSKQEQGKKIRFNKHDKNRANKENTH